MKGYVRSSLATTFDFISKTSLLVTNLIYCRSISVVRELSSVEISDNREEALTRWSSRERRVLPWRATRDPWKILLSEVMLQQTQVERVVPKYDYFVASWPDIGDFAQAPLEKILNAWSGLGFPRRAVNLHRTARLVVTEYGSVIPKDLKTLLTLPGVGPYTARAVLCFAYEIDIGVVDTNVGRILARWFGSRFTNKTAQSTADSLVPLGQTWEWNQGLFDLGALICKKHDPKCSQCPVFEWCSWQGVGLDPSIGSAGVSSSQKPFSGSDRQARGKLLRALSDGPVSCAKAKCVMGIAPETIRADKLVAALIADGLIYVALNGQELRLGNSFD